jgi:hypothetical protein
MDPVAQLPTTHKTTGDEEWRMREIRESYRKIGDPEDRFDIEFRQSQGPEAIFEAAWTRREVVRFGELSIPFISKEDLIQAKKTSGRPQDLIDIENLKKAQRLNSAESPGPTRSAEDG